MNKQKMSKVQGQNQPAKASTPESVAGKEMAMVRVVRPLEACAEHGALAPGQVMSLPAELAAEYVGGRLAIDWREED